MTRSAEILPLGPKFKAFGTKKLSVCLVFAKFLNLLSHFFLLEKLFVENDQMFNKPSNYLVTLLKASVLELTQWKLFFANRFLFSVKGTCYSVLMQFPILCHPKLMARKLNENLIQVETKVSANLPTTMRRQPKLVYETSKAFFTLLCFVCFVLMMLEVWRKYAREALWPDCVIY